jgi:hypothetical protein
MKLTVINEPLEKRGAISYLYGLRVDPPFAAARNPGTEP